jgi:hypothetical protein
MRPAGMRIERRDGRQEKIVRYEGMASPRELLQRIVLQCQQALRSLGVSKVPKATKNGRAMATQELPQDLGEETDALARFW